MVYLILRLMDRKLFDRYYKLLPKQSWLVKKEFELMKMISSCKTSQQKDLLFNLLEDFQYLNNDILNRYIESIADYIIDESEFDINKIQIVGMAMDDNPDSSQWILQLLKPVLTKKGWNNVKMTTRFDKSIKILNKGTLTQLVLVDEFIGSGQSVSGRIKLLKERASVGFNIKACFIAGTQFGVDKVIDDFDDFRCFIPLKKGISERYEDDEKSLAIANMRELETTLLQKIHDKELVEYHMGYNASEALYSSTGNTPNSVFPYFWWPYDSKRNPRNPILIRSEEGLGL